MTNTSGHRAKKSLGQNFLIDQNICRRIVDSLRPGPEDYIIEIGPGQGALTQYLVEAQSAHLTVLEMDDDLADRLFVRFPEIEVVRGDAMKYPWGDLCQKGSCKIIGNLPYNVGSKLIWDIVSQVPCLERAVFMVQHEVALRLTASAGTKAYGGLTAWVRNHANTEYLFKVPPTVFRPRPKVDSAVVAFTPRPEGERPREPEQLSALIKKLFQKRRKQLSTILKKEWSDEVQAWFSAQGIDPRARPETLTPEQFAELAGIMRCQLG